MVLSKLLQMLIDRYLLANAAGSRLPMGNVNGVDGNNFDSAGEIRNGPDD